MGSWGRKRRQWQAWSSWWYAWQASWLPFLQSLIPALHTSHFTHRRSTIMPSLGLVDRGALGIRTTSRSDSLSYRSQSSVKYLILCWLGYDQLSIKIRSYVTNIATPNVADKQSFKCILIDIWLPTDTWGMAENISRRQGIICHF